jgi:hypothetical protein
MYERTFLDSRKPRQQSCSYSTSIKERFMGDITNQSGHKVPPEALEAVTRIVETAGKIRAYTLQLLIAWKGPQPPPPFTDELGRILFGTTTALEGANALKAWLEKQG